jgi:hypothetical protein
MNEQTLAKGVEAWAKAVIEARENEAKENETKEQAGE